MRIVFWLSAGLLAYAQAGYGVLLAALTKVLPPRAAPQAAAELPAVSVIVAAYAEEDVIAARVENLRALEYPAEKLEVIVSCDGAADRTAELARAAGADAVLENPRGGKIRAQDAAVRIAKGEIVAFSDANAAWEADALRRLVAPFADPRVGYVCGDVRFVNEAGDNQEGLYWRYEMMLRTLESGLRSVTAGNGAIYATRRDAYIVVDPIMGHDLTFPFNMVKRGWLALYARDARAVEKMVPTLEGEFARKRRMMAHTWPIVVRGGLISPRGYDARYALMIFSHRILRYGSPFLHAAVVAANLSLLRRGRFYRASMALQAAIVAAAMAGKRVRSRPLLIARYYVLTTAALAAGLYDWMRHGTEAVWEPAQGTR